MSVVLLFGQNHCTPIGQEWYQVIEESRFGMSRHQKHDQERFFWISFVRLSTSQKRQKLARVASQTSQRAPQRLRHSAETQQGTQKQATSSPVSHTIVQASQTTSL